MSINWPFMKGCALYIKEIEKKTPIRKVVAKDGMIGLELDGNYVWTLISTEDEPILGVTSYGHSEGNNPTEIFQHLVREFELRFVSEFVIREYIEDMEPVPDEVIENYRKCLMDDSPDETLQNVDLSKSDTNNSITVPKIDLEHTQENQDTIHDDPDYRDEHL